MSKRERTIAIVTIAVIALLVLDRLIVSPLLARSDDLDAQISDASGQLLANQKLFLESRRGSRQWAEIAGKGLAHSASEAEGQLTNRMRQWAQDVGVRLTALNPQRDEKQKDFRQITLRATLTGRMSEVGRFLYEIEHASIPVRISDLTITGKDGTDDLSAVVILTSIYQPPESDKAGGSSPSSPAAQGRS